MELLVATIISLIVQGLKQLSNKFISKEWQNFMVLAILVALSFIAAWVVYNLKETGIWKNFYQIAIYAAGIWALFLKRLEKK